MSQPKKPSSHGLAVPWLLEMNHASMAQQAPIMVPMIRSMPVVLDAPMVMEQTTM